MNQNEISNKKKLIKKNSDGSQYLFQILDFFLIRINICVCVKNLDFWFVIGFKLERQNGKKIEIN